MADPVDSLVKLLARMPGIGERTAARLAYFVLGSDPQYAAALGNAIATIHEKVRRCERCGNWSANEICPICLDPRRDASTLCVVARVPDVSALEKSGTYRGRYHVLHALLAPLDGVGADAIDVDALARRIEEEGVEEIVLATPLSVEGEATALYLAQMLKSKVRVTRIASGLPHGGELEFADQITLGRAFEGRREL